MEPQRPAEDENARERSWLKALAIACGALTILTLWIGSGRDCLSNPDEAAYTEQADSILAGDDLTVGFVRHFHVRYPRGIDHVEDFYPPGNGALIALSWAVFGRSDFAAASPSSVCCCRSSRSCSRAGSARRRRSRSRARSRSRSTSSCGTTRSRGSRTCRSSPARSARSCWS
jgi:hypothetical protein